MSEENDVSTELAIASESAVTIAEPVAAPAPCPPALAVRLIKAQQIVAPLALDGVHAYHKFRYPSIAQVREHVNDALSQCAVCVIPSIVRVYRHERTSQAGNTVLLTAVDLRMTITAVDGSYTVSWAGESEDTSDKGIPKAVSAGLKSFLIALLLIPVAEPENDDGETEHARKNGPPAKRYHWIELDPARKRFWRWCRDDLTLTDEQVHVALGVEHIREYPGSMKEAKAQIEGWIEKQKQGDDERATTGDAEAV